MLTVLPALLVMVALLFSGSVMAQSALGTSGISEFTVENGNKIPVEFVDLSEVHGLIKTDYLATFPAQEPDLTGPANAAIIFKMKFYQKTSQYIIKTGDVSFGILRAFNEVKVDANNLDYGSVVQDNWKDDMVTLLSL